MATMLQYGLYIAMAAVVVILVMGLVNITRTNDEQASMSNKLMRARVIAQAVVVGILVLLGIVVGSIRLF
ncbi:MAG: twin transmembrane helix small protein [Henriciella sp.]|nr:twin transmembrane helix small protein [Henriciella sp.]